MFCLYTESIIICCFPLSVSLSPDPHLPSLSTSRLPSLSTSRLPAHPPSLPPSPQSTESHGTVLLSMCYSPDSKKLSVILLRAKDLNKENDKETGQSVRQPCTQWWPHMAVGGEGSEEVVRKTFRAQ